MYFSRMRTVRCSGHLSCHAHTLPCMPPCHVDSHTMHAPRPCMPSCHACPLPCMPPCHTCTLPCTPPYHAHPLPCMLSATHAPTNDTPLCHALPPPPHLLRTSLKVGTSILTFMLESMLCHGQKNSTLSFKDCLLNSVV